MLKKIFILFLLLFLFGCTSVTNYELTYYSAVCEDHGGIREAVAIPFPISIDYVVCQDGRRMRFAHEK